MLILLLCTVALGHLALGQEPLVTTSQGTMKGKVLKSRGGRDYFSFTKIPYAKPPVGPLRFMISEKADKWNGTLDATELSPFCHQANNLESEPPTIGQEDCLYLNVFTPNKSPTTNWIKYPVIFAIHGGGFNSGSAHVFGSAKYFMDEDVVFVSINYRLGTIGFLSFEDNIIPGNLGLKDQALALEWVHNEISAFGGDPNLITVIGGSAGGASANLICTAPRTNGLIKGCVSHSGVGWAPWSFLKPGDARKSALNFAKAVGCSENGLLKCLQDKPIELVGNSSLMLYKTKRITKVSPILEPVDAPGALLTSWPTSTNQNYPWILGVCQDDGIIVTGVYEYHWKGNNDTDNFINEFNQTIISELNLENKTNDFQKIWDRFFTKGYEPLIAIRNFYSEYYFVQPALMGLSKHPGPTYYYRFNYTGGPQMFVNENKAKGVGHGAESPYFFESSSNPPGWPNLEDIQLSKQLVKMWVNFARNQTPNSQEMVQWSQFQGQYYLDIQNSGVTVRNLTQYHEILDFWKSFFPDQVSKSSSIQSSLLFIGALSIFTTIRAIFA